MLSFMLENVIVLSVYVLYMELWIVVHGEISYSSPLVKDSLVWRELLRQPVKLPPGAHHCQEHLVELV